MKKFLCTVDVIRRLDWIIGGKMKGTVKELASQTNCCKRTLVDNIRDYNSILPEGVYAKYNHKDKNYQYSEPGHFVITIVWVPDL